MPAVGGISSSGVDVLEPSVIGCQKDPSLSDVCAAETASAPCEPKSDLVEDMSSDEDEDGQPKAKLGSGHWGHGQPLT